MRLSLWAVLAAALLSFAASPAEAQLIFRRAAPCPTCPNGVCQPQASGPMFAPLATVDPKPLPKTGAAATPPCPCTATNCTQGFPCPCTAGNCVCNPAPALSSASAGATRSASSAGRWYPGKFARRLLYGG